MTTKVNWHVRGFLAGNDVGEPDFSQQVQYVPDVARAVSDACGQGCVTVIVHKIAQLDLPLEVSRS